MKKTAKKSTKKAVKKIVKKSTKNAPKKQAKKTAKKSSKKPKGEWSKEYPTEPGRYWVYKAFEMYLSKLQYDCGAPLIIVELSQRTEGAEVRFYDISLGQMVRMWVADFASLYEEPQWKKLEEPALPPKN